MSANPIVSPLYCASCGAPATAKVVGSPCSYCNSPLLPAGHPDPRSSQRCSHCGTHERQNAQYCGSCGYSLGTVSAGVASELTCPGCESSKLDVWPLEPNGEAASLAGCPNCGGSWIDHQGFQLLQRRAALEHEIVQAGESPRAHEVRRTAVSICTTGKITYRSCPICAQAMARRNFAQFSGVIVDQCPTHGVFFDAGELESILDFVRSGGLAFARAKQSAEREAQKQASAGVAAIDSKHDSFSGGWTSHTNADKIAAAIMVEAVRGFCNWAQDQLSKFRTRSKAAGNSDKS